MNRLQSMPSPPFDLELEVSSFETVRRAADQRPRARRELN